MDSVESINPTLIAPSAIDRLGQTDQRDLPFMQTILEAQSTLSAERIPEGKAGLVLGSGPNTEAWKARGWFTLDIDPEAQAHYRVDANYMSASVPKVWDYIYAEAIRMDPTYQQGVNPIQLIDQAGRILKPGGTLVIKTANFVNNPYTTIPERDGYIQEILGRGYDVTAEVHAMEHYERDGQKTGSQSVVYYVKKPVPKTITY